MAFDISTARPEPVQSAGGFDISTAKPEAAELPKSIPEALPEDRGVRGRRQNLQQQPTEDIFAGLPPEIADRIKADTARRPSKRSPSPIDVDAARKMAELEKIRLINPTLAQVIEETGGVEAFAIGAGERVATLGRGVGLLDPATETEKMAFAGLKSQQPGAVGAGQFVGETAPFLVPAGAAARIASIPARVAAGSAIGATEGGVIASGEGRNPATGALIGGALGLGGELIPSFLPAGRNAPDLPPAQSIGGDVAPAPEKIQFTPPGQQLGGDIAQAPASTARDAAANSRREKVFADLGLTPTEAQRTRGTDLFVEQQDAFRRGGPVRDAIERQGQILDQRFDKNIEATGGSAARASSTPIESVVDKATQLDAQITQLYKQARDAAPGEKNVRFSRVAKSLRENAPLDGRTNKTITALRQQMKDQGFLDAAGKPTRLTSVEAAENMRQFANKLFDPQNGLTNSVIRDFKEALDGDVFKVAGEDVFKQARAAKTNFEAGLSATGRDKFDKRTTSLVRDMLDGSVQPDDIVNKSLNRGSKYKAKELKELRQYLHSGTEAQIAQGLRAWNDLRAAAFEKIKDKAFKSADTQSGERLLSRQGLENAFKEIGPDKLEVLFTPKERSFLNKLAGASRAIEPPPGTFTGSGPSSPAIDKITNLISASPVFRGSSQIMVDGIKGATNGLKSAAADRRVLKLTDDLQVIAQEAARRERQAFRRSSRAITTGQAAAIPQAVKEEEEQ